MRLDVGCGFIKHIHSKNGDVGIDLKRGLCDVVADAEHLPFKGSVFDAVSIISVLEHLHKPMQCLRESVRVAKKDAVFELVFPVDPRESIMELRRFVLEFPYGIPALLVGKYENWKYKPAPHITCVKPCHVEQVLVIDSMRSEGEHAWFQGGKGKLLRRLVKVTPIGAWRNWHIKAHFAD